MRTPEHQDDVEKTCIGSITLFENYCDFQNKAIKGTRYLTAQCLTAYHAIRMCDVLPPPRYEKLEAQDTMFTIDESGKGTFKSALS